MRELVYKNLMSSKSLKKDISIEEIVCKDGIVSKTLKRSRYFVRNVSQIDDREELEGWIGKKDEESASNKRWFHIMKTHSDKDKTDKVLCKARGSFYAIIGKNAYNIVFVHCIRFEIETTVNRSR